MTNELVTRLRAASPSDADAVFKAAAQAIRSGYEDEALPLLERASALHPDDARIWQAIGLAHRNREDLEASVAAFRKSAALAPEDPLIAHSLARTSLEAGLSATELFGRALRLAPDDEQIRLGLVASLFAEGRIDQAIALIEERLKICPGWLQGHRTLARLLWMKGERESFAATYELATASAPRDANHWREWADVLLHAGHYEEVLALLARARREAGGNALFDALETIAVAEQGRTEEADRLFASLGPITQAGMAIRYLRHLLRAGRPAEAIEFAESWTMGGEADLIHPYFATALRLTGDPRWEELEGDERLVGIYDLSEQILSLPALAERLRGLHLALGQPLEQSVRGGTQTDGPLFSRIETEIRALRAAVVATVERHIAQLPESARPRGANGGAGKIRFAGSWSVRLPGAGYHSNHVHPAGWISSAFYAALPESMGDGQQGWFTLGQPQAELGLDLAPFRTIEPKPGRLVLFPSTMWHGTIPFEAGERLTAAFDVARPAG